MKQVEPSDLLIVIGLGQQSGRSAMRILVAEWCHHDCVPEFPISNSSPFLLLDK
jgi:hypothetical protein